MRQTACFRRRAIRNPFHGSPQVLSCALVRKFDHLSARPVSTGRGDAVAPLPTRPVGSLPAPDAKEKKMQEQDLDRASTSDDSARLPRLLRLREVAARLGCHPITIRRLAKKGKFPRPIRVGRQARWLSSEVRAWLTRRPRG